MSNKEVLNILEDRNCKKCEHFTEGVICRFELENEGSNIYDIMYKRRNVCKLDLEPTELRQQVYKGLENEGKLFDILLSNKNFTKIID